MSDHAILCYLDDLEKAARSASTAEESLRREFTRRFADLEKERQFAFRRHGLMLEIWKDIAAAKDEVEADERCDRAFQRELNWTGASEMQRNVTERFRPVGAAMWQAAKDGSGGDIDNIARELTAFESWYQESYDAPFLILLEHEVETYPLVEG